MGWWSLIVIRSEEQNAADQGSTDHRTTPPNVRALRTAEHQYNVHVYLDKEGAAHGQLVQASRCGFRELSGNGFAPIRDQKRNRFPGSETWHGGQGL